MLSCVYILISGDNFSRRKFIKKRIEKLIGLHVKWTKYIGQDFKLRHENLTDFHGICTKTHDKVLLKDMLL